IFSANGPGANDQLHPSADHIFCISGKLSTFFCRLRIILAGRPADNNAVYLRLNQRLQYFGVHTPVDLPIRLIRSHRWCIDAFKFQDDFSEYELRGRSTSASALMPWGAIKISMLSQDSSQCSNKRPTTAC